MRPWGPEDVRFWHWVLAFLIVAILLGLVVWGTVVVA